MDSELATLKRVHDAALQLGASCDGSCFWDTSAYDSLGKSYTQLRAQALTVLSTLN